jgi:glucose-1-phosphate cytidylyltransferase
MKAVILAGGLGTRLKEVTEVKPKPLIDVGGRPILWHIMKIYSHFGINDFIICLGYKGYLIKEYFSNYNLHMSDVTFDMGKQARCEVHQNHSEPWRVTLVDTGEHTMTGGRVKRIAPYLGGDDTFLLTYGDGLADVDVAATIAFHKKHGRKATLTAVIPPARFGAVNLAADGRVTSFQEKPLGDNGYINGGYFVLSQDAIGYIRDDATLWEKEPLENLTREGELMAFVHNGFWHPMDTLRDKEHLDKAWESGRAPWKLWA